MTVFGRNKVQLWERTLEKLGRILSDEYGIKVIFKYDTCLTTGKEIYLPVIPEGARQEFLDAVQGYLDHEASHILFTDFNQMKAAGELGRKHHMLTNGLEDSRVERQMIQLWRGSRINLNNCAEWSLPQLRDRWDELTEFGKVAQGITAVAMQGEDHWFVQEVVKPDAETWAKVEQCKDYAVSASTMGSTEECYEAARKIMEVLQEEDEPMDQPYPEPEEGEEGDQNRGTLRGDEQIMNRANQIRKEAQEDCFKYSKEKDRYLVYTTEGDVIEYVKDGDKMKCHDFLTDSKALTNPIRQKFRRNLLTETKCKWLGGKRRGAVNPNALHRVALGTSKSVFRKKIEAPDFDTVVSMFIDHSGSMFSEKMNLAAESSIIFGECLNDIGVPFEICGFSTLDHYIGINRYNQASQAERDLFTRWGDLWIGVYKQFDDNWMTTRHRCVQMSRNDHDNTFDGEALRLAAQRLLMRPEKRRILFWLNDGYPCPNVSQCRQQHASYLTSVVKEVERHIEVFAIGIQSDQVKNYFSNWVLVNTLSDLPKVVVGELDRLLRKKQFAYKKVG